MTDASNLTGGGFPLDRGLLRAVLTHVDELVVTCTSDGTMTFVSHAVAMVLGYEAAEVEGRNFFEFLHPDEHEEVLEGLARWTGRTGSPRGQVQRIRAASGQWVEVHYDVLLGADADPLGGYVITIRPPGDYDGERRALLQRLLDEDRLVRLASVFLRRSVDEFDGGLEEAVGVLSGLEWVTRISVWTLAGDQVERRAQWEASSNAPSLPLPPRFPVAGTPFARRLASGEEVHIRSVAHLPDDWAADREALLATGIRSVLAVPMSVEGQFTGFVMAEITIAEVAFDVSQRTVLRSAAAILASAFQRNEAERELARRARIDVLTGLGNRWAFLEAVDTARAAVASSASPGYAVAVVDLDRFAQVNEVYGHEAGDRLLSAVAERLGRAVAPPLRLFHLHGDEFLALAPGVPDAFGAADAVRAMVGSLEPPFEVAGHPVHLSATAGVVHTADPDVGGMELISRADLVMQGVRSSAGHQQVGVEDRGLRLEVATRMHRQRELRGAVVEERVAPHYQGEWDLVTGRLVGAEALARWQHPVEGMLAATEFIPLAEETGLIAELGESVLRRACREAANWPEPVALRVNVSARQLHDIDVRGLVGSALSESGLAAERLCIELTETALLADPVHAVGVLDSLRSDGVGLAIDDFGTGYSSLLYLKRLPVTSLKIDRSFVSGLPADDDDRAIVQAIVRLAETLGLSLTAEGVETEDQREALLDLGCTFAQGYLLSRPEPNEDFAGRLAAIRA